MKSYRTFIIAEAGVNHNGSIRMAKKMIDVAAAAGVDAVKFQTFQAALLASKFAPKAEYQLKTTQQNESQFQMLKKLELSAGAHKELIAHCKKSGVIFLSTPFDLESIDLLNSLGLMILKIPSGEIINLPYLRKIGSLKKKIILSTGMADLFEVKRALSILMQSGTPKQQITVLHCHTDYPTAYKDVNLLAMLSIKNRFKINIGYSDHTPGIEIAIAAVALGAKVIEKHFTLDRTMNGPDHRASLEPDELAAMVAAIRNLEKAMGNGIKRPTASEIKNKTVARKSLIAARYIQKGEKFTVGNLTVKRPGFGISPMDWDRVLGKTAKKDFMADELIAL
ncbi:MAG: N-acetylneuraminate synthase [Candidatus Omnitrophota bacterium]